MHGALPALLPPLTLTLTLSRLWKGYLNVHTWTTGKFTNRYVISIVMIPGWVIALVPSPGGGFSTDQRPVHGADCHCAMLSLGLQHCTDVWANAKPWRWEMPGVQGTGQTSGRSPDSSFGPHPPLLPACHQRSHFSPLCLCFLHLFEPTKHLTL